MPVRISIVLMKIVRIEEVDHKIEFQFGIVLEWPEIRALFFNLKFKSSLNALTDDEIHQLWLPYVIYDNTDMKEVVQLEEGTKTTVTVSRQGGFTRSGLEVEIFEGGEIIIIIVIVIVIVTIIIITRLLMRLRSLREARTN